VSREGESRRRVTNEAEVIDLVCGFGFEVVRPGEMTVGAQADLFSQADMVIGPHGGGLTNMMFCAPGTTIIELISPVFQVLCYWTLASSAGLHYELHFGLGPRASKETQPRYSQWHDIDVDCDLLAQRLRLA
jgi:capsular polysaccharide biosynthesis protein